mgnify:FL=1|tara:strand:- start:2886 stop:3614 length:729 start_codon:yes stop_codon:yes gene_type:complete
MSQDEIVEKLRIDEHYYGKFGNQFLSNSDISVLLSNPLNFKKPSKSSPAFLVGGYFHTCILEPDKLKKYKIIESSSRNTKVYKEMSGGELCLLQHEVDQIEVMRDKMLNNEIISKLITGNVEYEVPGVIEIENNMWKGKADIINHDERLIIDLKTTNDIQSFRYSAKRYNYDSQAYIYNKLFNYDFLFIVVDKNTHQLGLFDVSDKFYQTGLDKVQKATDVYELFYKTENFKPENYFINQTL